MSLEFKNSLITAYLSCFPDKTREYAESYLSDLEQYQVIVYEEPASSSRKRGSINIDSRFRGNEATEEKQVYAFVIYRTISPDEAEIIDIGVIPDKRKQGVGAKILNEMEFELRKQKVKKIHLELREDNFPAEKLYRKLGYIKVGERKNYYKMTKNGCSEGINEDNSQPNSVNAILMTKFI